MVEDKIIWEDFKDEKEYALSYIYNQNIDFLFFYGKKFTDDEDFILDTLHDLFCYLIQTRKNLGKTDHIRFYLMTAFKRRLFKEIQLKNKQLLISENFHFEGDFIFSVEEDLIRDEDYSTRLKLIRQGMNELNAKQREILYYKFTCDFDYPQICAIMCITYDAARQLVSRAICLMRKYLEVNDFCLFFIFKDTKYTN
ncbi:MAG TPA: sigma-70 family RNA polymerase sigma factor [Prolixibacteraceae bacterium]|jgi:RNA polymerase sigma factor (sigma-70 family)